MASGWRRVWLLVTRGSHDWLSGLEAVTSSSGYGHVQPSVSMVLTSAPGHWTALVNYQSDWRASAPERGGEGELTAVWT